MKIKADKQRNFTTSTMSSSANYDAEFAEELATQSRSKSTTENRNKNYGEVIK